MSFRPPVVTIMGHIDHGKTTLLDKIRTGNVASREAGGITQHVSAYQVEVKGQKITFIDTPGHAAFVKMRERGAQVTDLIVLVISAQDGVMVQTKECLEIIKTANVPFIVAINKIDLAGASLDKVKGQLVEAGYTPEDYGGQLACIPVSAKTGENIDKLLDSILLNASVLELKDESEAPLEALVFESRLDPHKGPLATLVVKKGILKLGDLVYSANSSGKVKALLDFNKKPITIAGPSVPVEVLSFTTPPEVGTVVTTTPQELKPATAGRPDVTYAPNSPDKVNLNVILKADTQGTLQALENSFSEEVTILSASVGPVGDNDVFLAQTTNSTIYAFNVKIPPIVAQLIQNSKVDVFESKIIYEIIENIQQKVLKLMEPTIDETFLADGLIIAEFKINKVRIAGVKITKGEIHKNDLIHLKREDKIIKDTKVGNLQQGKNVVEVVKVGAECGMTFTPYVDFKVGDAIISYRK